jgi:succinate-semialdehyde dehydrogenase/glutarate-semialdehyde dehydrogenase
MMLLNFESGIYIGGQWVHPVVKAVLEVKNPATGELIATLPAAGPAEARAAVVAAHNAFKSWSSLSANERGAYLRKANLLFIERAQEIGEIMTLEQGKPIAEAVGEVLWGADYLLWYAEEIRRSNGSIVPSDSASQRFYLRRRARGVVACITPWNFPNAMLLRKIAPAVAAGNTIVAKPAEETPLSAIKIFEVFHDAGFPAGVLNLVCGEPAPIGDVLMESPEVRQISFTGSTEIGRMLSQRAGAQLKKITVELGGVAPFIVFPDADLDVAINNLMWGKFANQGQSCVAPNRVLIHQDVFAEFTALAKKRVEELKLGHGVKGDFEVGPMISEEAVLRVNTQLEDAKKRGATVVAGGELPIGIDPKRWCAPTIIINAPMDALVNSHETFGPLIAFEPFTSEQAMLNSVNASESGLGAYLFTSDLATCHRVSEALEYGMVAINGSSFGYVQTPFGGTKGSGDGREGGQDGLLEYQELQYINLNF